MKGLNIKTLRKSGLVVLSALALALGMSYAHPSMANGCGRWGMREGNYMRESNYSNGDYRGHRGDYRGYRDGYRGYRHSGYHGYRMSNFSADYSRYGHHHHR